MITASNVIVVLSGPIGVGKSSVAERLAPKRFVHLRTRQCLIHEAKMRAAEVSLDRESMQAWGAKLDADTEYKWLVNHVGREWGYGMGVIVDSVRKIQQVRAIRQMAQVFHVHLTARTEALHNRYSTRGDSLPWADAMRAEESDNSHLKAEADLVIDTSRMTPGDVKRIILGYTGSHPERGVVDVLVGGQYGSEGKGHVVSYLAPEYQAMMRVGGPNAGHTVLHPDTGEKISFYHLPSGALHMHGPLLLGPGANIRIPVLASELRKSGIEPDRVIIDPQANIITNEDIDLEHGLVSGIGSTGQGVGAATAGRVMGRSEGGRPLAHRSSNALRELGVRVEPTADALEHLFKSGARVLMEGTQGTGLSLYHGPYPYVTSRDTSVSGTLGEAGIAPAHVDQVFMVCRTNPIRVQSPKDGTSGPMSLETTWEEIAQRAMVDPDLLRKKEMTTTTKRQRRVAEFDWELLHRSARLNMPTQLALTFVDYIDEQNHLAWRYEQLTDETHRMIEAMEAVTGARVTLITTKFEKRSIIDRR